MRIAFHAPLKGPGHPLPSGDRAMARLLIAALERGGHEVELVSTFRSFLAESDGATEQRLEAAAAAESEAIAQRWLRGGAPDIWFTYHPFYKSPDLLGPRLARRFGLVYATAEASDAPKRAGGPWARWHRLNEAALRAADVHFCLTPDDRRGLAKLLGLGARLVDLPPFIDARPFTEQRLPRTTGVTELITVAMMRPGDKLRSYALLAEALVRLPTAPAWRLTIVGDGPAEPEIRRLYESFPPERLVWAGQQGADDVAAGLRASDLFVWPGFGEAYGMAYLEAGAAGIPAVAMRSGGVETVVRDGVTGIITPEGDVEAYAAALGRLIRDPEQRNRLGSAAYRFVTGERTVAAAAATLTTSLTDLMQSRARVPA